MANRKSMRRVRRGRSSVPGVIVLPVSGADRSGNRQRVALKTPWTPPFVAGSLYLYILRNATKCLKNDIKTAII